MKKQLQIFTALVFVGIFFATAAIAADFLSITTNNANVRTGPGTSHPSILELFVGYPLKILKKQGEWFYVVDYENDLGWVHTSVVKKCDTVIVNVKRSVNVRSGPSTKDQIIADAERGVVFAKLATKEKWTKVIHNNSTTGWIYSSLLWP